MCRVARKHDHLARKHDCLLYCWLVVLCPRYVIGVASSYDFSRSVLPRLKRAYILILIINYTCRKAGLSVKRAWFMCETSQILHNLVLFKLFWAAFAPFSF